MFRIHESWREELGWMLIVVGFAVFEYGVINLAANLRVPASDAMTYGIMAAAAVALVLGLILHATRPSKKAASDAKRAVPAEPSPTSPAQPV